MPPRRPLGLHARHIGVPSKSFGERNETHLAMLCNRLEGRLCSPTRRHPSEKGRAPGGHVGVALSSSAANRSPVVSTFGQATTRTRHNQTYPGPLETRGPADGVKRTLLDDDEDRRTIKPRRERPTPLTERCAPASG